LTTPRKQAIKSHHHNKTNHLPTGEQVASLPAHYHRVSPKFNLFAATPFKILKNPPFRFSQKAKQFAHNRKDID